MPKEKNEELPQAEGVGRDEIVVKKADFAAVMDRLNALEQGATSVTLDEPTHRTARVRMYQGRPVTKVANVKRTKEYETDGSEIMECDLTVINKNGAPETLTADYMKFVREAEYVTGTIKEVIDKVTEYVPHGEPERVEVSKVDGYRTEGTGVFVKNVVKGVQSEYVMELPSGEIVKLETLNL